MSSISYKAKPMFKRERDRKVVKHGLKQLINNERLSDIKFSVGIENKIYYGVKALFAINSPKMNDLLYHNDNNEEKDVLNGLNGLDGLDEFESLDDQIIPLNHITCKAFEFIQSYLYQNPKKLSIKYLIDILLASKYFGLDNIEQKCIEGIKELKQTTKYISYFIEIVNELYHKKQYEMANNMLISTNYVIVEFIFISLSNNNNNNKPIYYAVTMEKNQTINDLKKYILLKFITDSLIDKELKDLIVCTIKNKNDLSFINIESDDTIINDMIIINQSILIYYCPLIIIGNDKEMIIKIYNKNSINIDCFVSLPLVIKVKIDNNNNKKLFENKIFEIVQIILNDKNNDNDGNNPYKIKYNEEFNEITLFWNEYNIKNIDEIWSKINDKQENYCIDYNLRIDDDKDKDLPYWDIKQDVIKVRKSLIKYMDNPKYADVKFEIGTKSSLHKTIYGISSIFAIQSVVFDAQFYGNMFESKKNDKILNIRLCIIDDLSPNSFEFLRCYFYNLDPMINSINAVEIVYASTKYLLPSLQHPCSKFINSLYDTMDIYTCLPIMIKLYNIGFHDMSISLLNKSMNLYKNAKITMEQKNEFLSLPIHILKSLICNDQFGANEYYIYLKLIEWTKYQSNNDNDHQKQLMQQFKYLIRWTLIPLIHFKNDECGKYCLNEDELKLINDILTKPNKFILNDFKYFNNFKCFYRDFNKNTINDQYCLSKSLYIDDNKDNKDIDSIMFEFIFCDLDFKNPERNRLLKSPTFYGCIINKNFTIDQFRKYCSKRFNIINNDYQNIFICLILAGKIFHVFDINDKIIDFDFDKYLICVYYSPLINIRCIKIEMNDDNDNDDDDSKENNNNNINNYPYSETIDGWNYRWNYIDDIEEKKEKKKKKKKQHLLSIVHIDPEHNDILKPLCGIPILLNLYCETKITLFTLQKHYLSNIARIIMDDYLYESIQKSNVQSIKFIDDNIKKYFNIVVRKQFIYYNALDTESILKLNKSDTQNILCLKFENDQIHNFKKSFTHSIKYCRKHISALPTSKQWKLHSDYTEKKMIRIFRTKQSMKLKSKPIEL